MKYMGSKNRIANEIIPIMLKYRTNNNTWVEPFVGGGNMIDKIDGDRIGSDINPYVISALISIRDNISDLPKNNTEFTEADYKLLRKNDDYKYKGYAGFAFSYGGKWLGGWSRTDKSNVKQRDYVNESYRNALNQSIKLQNVKLIICSYLDLIIPNNSIIYCDPPYEGTTKYKNKFDHIQFWEWCRQKSKEGHTVFVSEYNASDDFECIWQKEIVSSLTQDTGSKKAIEKLFIYKK
jgi:DNA adenine methylase